MTLVSSTPGVEKSITFLRSPYARVRAKETSIHEPSPVAKVPGAPSTSSRINTRIESERMLAALFALARVSAPPMNSLAKVVSPLLEPRLDLL